VSRRLQHLPQAVVRARSGLSTALRRRVRTVRARQARHELAVPAAGVPAAALADPRVADLAFRGGYLIRSAASSTVPPGDGWTAHTIADRVYHVRTPMVSAATKAGGTVVLLGHPVDVDTDTADAQLIADRLAAVADTGSGADPVLEGASGLGGRWTLVLHQPDGSLTVLPDALVSQPVLFSADGTVIASHEAFLTDGTHLPVSSALEVTSSGASTRPYPATPPDPDVATFEAFRERLVRHVRLLTGAGRPAVALTAGPSSHAVLAAYLPHRAAEDFTFTYFEPESARHGRGPATDMFRASALAHRLGIPHRVIRAVDPPSGSVFELAYRWAAPHGDAIGAAFARHHLPPDTVELHSAGAETGETQSWVAMAASVRDGDLGHRVALPFNDRRLLGMLVHQPAGQSFVTRLAAELGDQLDDQVDASS